MSRSSRIPASSPGRSMPVGRAEAEAPHPAVEALGAEPLADHDRADVGGLREDLARGERAVADRVRLADLAVGDGDRGRKVEARARRDLALLQRGRDGERLERGARLVVGADRAVLAGVVGRVAERVGVDLRPVGEREDGAVARIHDDRGRALRLPLLPDLREDLLGAVLHVGVEREADPGSRVLALHLPQLDGVAERVLDEAALAVAALQDARRASTRDRRGPFLRCR